MANIFNSLLVLTFLIVVVFVPFVRYSMAPSSGRSDILEQVEVARKTQTDLITIIDELTKNATLARAVLNEIKGAVKQKKSQHPTSVEEFDARSKASIEKFVTSVNDEITKLRDFTKKSYSDFKSMVGGGPRIGTFIVKWHGDDGIKMSEKFTAEDDAISFYSTVGDYAKKLLFNDGSGWSLLKTYGGSQWLALITDNDNAQEGQYKPTKPPARKAATVKRRKAEDADVE
eukprot:PhM_4_TR4700/c0_g1_i1/m.34154